MRNFVFHSFSFKVFFSISPSPMPFFLWCPVLTLLPIDIVVKLSSSQPDWKLLRFFSVQVVFSPPRVLPQVRSIILRIVDGRSLVVKVHIEVVLSLPHVVLHGDALVHSDTALSLLFRLTHCPQIRTGHSLAWHFTQFLITWLMILPKSHKHKPTQARTSPIETRAQTDLQMRPPCETCPASSTEHKYPSTNSSQAPTCDDTNMYIVQSKPIKAHSWATKWSKCAALKSHLSGKVFVFHEKVKN